MHRHTEQMSIQITREAENVPSVISFLEKVSDRYPQHGPSPQAPRHVHANTHAIITDKLDAGQRLSSSEESGAAQVPHARLQ